MPSFQRTASAVWRGSGSDGSGTLDGPSGLLSGTPYSSAKRFQNPDGRAGTNPEELIAAAHAGCFIMALSFQIDKAGFTAEELRCTSTIDMNNAGSGWNFEKITLELDAAIPGISEAKFQELAQAAKSGCPVSKALAAVPIELVARLGKG
jgi:osmotically inducible protein OsmC